MLWLRSFDVAGTTDFCEEHTQGLGRGAIMWEYVLAETERGMGSGTRADA